MQRASTDFENERLIATLETFWSLVSHKLNLKTPSMTSNMRMDLYYKFQREEKTLYCMLMSGPGARGLTVTLAPEEKQVYLCRSYLTELSDSIAELGDVSVFQTCCNYLRYIPSSIGQLKNLKMLILSRNRLVELPDELGLCRELRELDVSFNALKRLPRALAGLRNLNTLHIAGNQLMEIPAFLGKLTSLKYLSIGSNPIKFIPLEIFKLPFLLNLIVDNVTFSHSTSCVEVGTLTLREIAARHIIKNNLKIHRDLSVSLREYLMSVQECAFCNGPFFDNYIEITDMHTFEALRYPVSYKMCCRHYSRHEDRLRALFEDNLATMPMALKHDQMPSITELFEPYCLSSALQKYLEDGHGSGDSMVPLISLAKYNMPAYKKISVERLLNENTENFNVVD